MRDRMELIQMARVAKHLEKIRIYIDEQEFEDIDDHVEEIEKLPAHPEVAHITMLLKLGLYQAAIQPIEAFIRECKIMANQALEERLNFFWYVKK